jgi:hypothetical protein
VASIDRRLKARRGDVDNSRMADQRQPDYDFFGPGRAAQRPPAPPAQPYGVPPAPPPPQAQPPQQPYGVSPQRFEPGGGPPAPYFVPRRSRAVTALIVAAVVVGVVVVAGIVAAVAIPVFVHQRIRADWKATTVSLPETFDGGARTEVSAAVRSQLSVADAFANSDIAVYRTGGVTVLAVAGKPTQPLAEADGAEVRRGMLAGMAGNGVSVSLAETDPGRLGGWFGCGTLGAQPASVCLATDHGSFVMVVVSGSDDPASVARRMRESAVHR